MFTITGVDIINILMERAGKLRSIQENRWRMCTEQTFVTNILCSLWGGHLISKEGKILTPPLSVKQLSWDKEEGLWACLASRFILGGLLVSCKEGRPLLCFWAGTISLDQVSERTASGFVSKVCKDTVAD